MIEAFKVAQLSGPDGAPAPPEIAERFGGRAWTKHQLEERGVRITVADAWYLASGRDWQLGLEAVASTVAASPH